ncbi:hypothetical protein BDA99DRAFT_533504 [Phascolomyces articulosus]|uniref:Uncharacterized protein n=1 Tax=Phascolomyces articulosus TaxID=60185 RepID=A0AAD5K728_9FUNG|nr:hypothetical protein BDA99DRAFT_533504 [Phascolomyces articulosus]
MVIYFHVYANIYPKFETLNKKTGRNDQAAFRSLDTLKGRWKTIHPALSKFCGYLDGLKATERSGWVEEAYLIIITTGGYQHRKTHLTLYIYIMKTKLVSIKFRGATVGPRNNCRFVDTVPSIRVFPMLSIFR